MMPKLYKYMSEQGLDLLQNQRIRVTPPIELNDAFEFQPLFDGTVSRAKAKAALDRKSLREMYDFERLTGRIQCSFKTFKRQMRQVTPQTVSLVQEKVSNYLDINRHTLITKLSKAAGVICLTEVPDSLLMWAHYASSHAGFVVEFNVDHPLFKKAKLLEPIRYCANRPVIRLAGSTPDSLSKQGKEALFTKSTEWEYEKEWRISTSLIPATNELVGAKTRYFLPLPHAAVSRLILGIRASNSLRESIQLCLRQGTAAHIELAQAQLHGTEYCMVIRKI